ncbi:MAG: tryptophan synthase subunit alpha [Oscillospiraceae bacterium]
MNRIDLTFEKLKENHKKALITFVTAGDPSLEMTEKIVVEMAENGADIVEIGVPFSDPIAEGEVIQNASARSIKNGTTLVKIFESVKNIRQKTDIPLVFMMYLNTIFAFGTEKFFQLCKEFGIDGVIVPDMPFEESGEILPFAEKYGVISISLVTPTSHQRVKMIAEAAKGFLYCVSSTGVTGARKNYSTNFEGLFEQIKKYSNVPCAVGFGISSPEQAKELSKFCDGIIVGSAIVNLIDQNRNSPQKPVREFVSALKNAM